MQRIIGVYLDEEGGKNEKKQKKEESIKEVISTTGKLVEELDHSFPHDFFSFFCFFSIAYLNEFYLMRPINWGRKEEKRTQVKSKNIVPKERKQSKTKQNKKEKMIEEEGQANDISEKHVKQISI